MRRSESPLDPWSGDVALPGGRREPGDASLADTARRETLEETGLDLAGARLLGRLNAVSPVSRHLPALTVTPFVFEAAPGAAASPASPEIASVHWVALAALEDPGALSTYILPPRSDGGPTLKFPCYRLDGLVVWGLTYRILAGYVEGRRARE